MRVVAFYTVDAVYGPAAECLRKSLEKHGVNHDVQSISPGWDWKATAALKPQMIRSALRLDDTVVYTDADSILCRPFDLTRDVPGVWDVAYPVAPWGEILSGTIAFRPGIAAQRFVDAWIARIAKYGSSSQTADQPAFQHLVKNPPKGVIVEPLPLNYCKIFDLSRHIADPVFLHYQASCVAKGKNTVQQFLARLGHHL